MRARRLASSALPGPGLSVRDTTLTLREGAGKQPESTVSTDYPSAHTSQKNCNWNVELLPSNGIYLTIFLGCYINIKYRIGVLHKPESTRHRLRSDVEISVVEECEVVLTNIYSIKCVRKQ